MESNEGFEAAIVNFFFSLKRIHLSKEHDQYMHYLMSSFDKIVYFLKLRLVAEQQLTEKYSDKYFDILYKLILFTRDITFGMGEQTLSHLMIFVWYKYFPIHACSILNFLPQYSMELAQCGHGSVGSWKDVVFFCKFVKYFLGEECPIIETCVGMLNHQLDLDVQLLKKRDELGLEDVKEYGKQYGMSLVAKWIPRENSQFGWLFDRCVIQWVRSFRPMYFSSVVTPLQFDKALKKGKREYRKIVSDISRKLYNVQHKQCSHKWETIDLRHTSMTTRSSQHNAFFNVLKNGEPRAKTFNNDDRNLCKYKSQAYYLKKRVENEKRTELNVNNKQLGIFLGPILKNIMELDNPVATFFDSKIISLLRTWRYSLKQFGGFEHVLPFLDLSLYGNSGWWDAMAMAIMIASKSSLGIRIMAYDSEPVWIAFEDFQDNDEGIFFTNTLGIFRKVISIAKQRKECVVDVSLVPAMEKVCDGFVQSQTSPFIVNSTICIVFSDFPNGLSVLREEHLKIKNIFSLEYKTSEVPHMVYWNMGSGCKENRESENENPFCVKTWSIRNLSSSPEYTLFAGGSSYLLKYLGTLSCFEWKQLTSFELLNRILQGFPIVL